VSTLRAINRLRSLDQVSYADIREGEHGALIHVEWFKLTTNAGFSKTRTAPGRRPLARSPRTRYVGQMPASADLRPSTCGRPLPARAPYPARRAGPGGTWQAPVQVSGAETSGGSDGGDIKTNTFGDVFAFWPSEGKRKLYVAKSTNGGSSFAAPVEIASTNGAFLIGIPAQASRSVLLYISGGAYRTSSAVDAVVHR
jgi:hypothetical protein